jgi:uncharacterized RDD family membrane protein YckC
VARWWYAAAGEPTGPLGDDQVRAMAGQGALSPASAVYREDVGEWRPLEQFEAALGLGRNSWGGYFLPAVREPEAGADTTEPATRWQRFAAWWIDGFVIRAVCWALLIILHPTWSGGLLTAGIVIAVLGMVVPLSYETLLHAVRGQTVGKRVMGIEVVGRDASELLGLHLAFARSLVGAITWPATIVLTLCTADRRGLHDRAVNSWVQKVT